MKDNQFSRLITLLRKEKGISQKKAAEELNISQALLSHYEKGIRECRLDFVIKAAKYYGVSSDFLLGISPNKKGEIINAEDIPDENAMGRDNKLNKNVLPTLNKRVIINTLNIIYELLSDIKSKELTNEVSGYIYIAVYKMFRYIYSMNSQNPQSLFATEKALYSKMTDSALSLCEMKIACLTGAEKSKAIKAVSADLDKLMLNQGNLEEAFPMFAGSLFNLIQNTESRIGTRKR